MNLLFVTQALPYLPAQDGFRVYAGNLLREFAKRHRVDLISLLQGDDERRIDWCQEYCASVTTFPAKGTNSFFKPFQFAATYGLGRPLHQRRKIAGAIRRGFSERHWDVLHVEGGYVAGLIPDGLPIPRILSLHDSWKIRCEQMSKCSPTSRDRSYYRVLSRVEPRYERLVYPRFDRCVVVAESDARAVQAVVPESKVAVISNGIDVDYYRPLNPKPSNAVLTFHGNLSYAPNVEAALNFADEVFPLIRAQSADASFHIIGAHPVQAIAQLVLREGITLSADLPDLREAVASARAYVCPIRHGSGVKNKLLEAMALGIPIVCYPESAVGIDCTPGKHLLIARDPEMFANAVLWLMRNPGKCIEMAEAARSLVEEKYSWESRCRAFEDIYQQASIDRGLKFSADSRHFHNTAKVGSEAQLLPRDSSVIRRHAVSAPIPHEGSSARGGLIL